MLKIGAQVCFRKFLPELAKPPVLNLLKKESFLLCNGQPTRNTSFLNRLSQEQLWKGVLSVSSAGKRKGRGRGKKGRRNLNAGQRIGTGKEQVSWPGLNTAILSERGISEIKKVPEKKLEQPAQVSVRIRRRRQKINPLERGWSGAQIRGRRIGPPDPVQDETFEGFESIVLEHKLKSQMAGALGRKRLYYTLVATGNGNGVIGVGKAKSPNAMSAVKLAKNRAAKRLLTVDLIEKSSVNHDFFSEYGRSRLVVLKQPQGHGLICHRIIKALCQLIGIENLFAKLRGPPNPKHMVRAFIIGLLRQKTYQEIADDNKLHLVMYQKESFNFPQLLASPEECLSPKEARTAILYEEYIMGGKLLAKKRPRVPFYEKLPSWTTYLKRTQYHRNHVQVKIELLVKYGACMSHLTKTYPECRLARVKNADAPE